MPVKYLAVTYTNIGQFAGFTLRVLKTREGIKSQIVGAGNYDFQIYPGNTTYGINHLIAVVKSVDEKVAKWSKNLAETKADLEVQKQLAAEPFEQAEKLKQKRTRYNEVMDILNPPKEEQNLDTDGGDAVQYQQRNYYDGWNSYELSDEFKKEVSYADRHAFLRSLANQTKNIEDGQIRKITIWGGDTVYFFAATGYMNGNIEKKLSITENNKTAINELRKEFGNVAYTSAKTFDTWSQTVRSNRGRDGWDNATSGYAGVSGRNDAVDDGESGSDFFGSAWESLGYNSWEEVIEAIENGAMIPDENGDLIVLEQYQQRTQALTDREVLQLAAEQLRLADLTDGERDALNIINGRLKKLEELQSERTAQGELYRQQQFTAPADRQAAQQTKNRMEVLDGQIKKAEATVLAVEDKQVLKAVLQKARKVVAKEQWTKDQKALKRWRDRRNDADAIRKYRARLKKDVDEMTNWVLHPNNKDVVKQIAAKELKSLSDVVRNPKVFVQHFNRFH